MEKKELINAINKAKEVSSKRNFKQSFDLIINLKGIDLKKTEQQVNIFVQLHYPRGREAKICALVGPELLGQAKRDCHGFISIDDFGKYSDKRAIKKLADSYDYFIAQATIMPKIATAFGRVFGPRGKMPNPKAGCVVPPNANLKQVVERLQKTVTLRTKNDPIIMTSIGKENAKEEELADNAMTIYNAVIHSLPNEKYNVKSVYIKLTMSKPVMVGEREEEKEVKKKVKPKVEKKEAVKEEEKEEVKEQVNEESKTEGKKESRKREKKKESKEKKTNGSQKS